MEKEEERNNNSQREVGLGGNLDLSVAQGEGSEDDAYAPLLRKHRPMHLNSFPPLPPSSPLFPPLPPTSPLFPPLPPSFPLFPPLPPSSSLFLLLPPLFPPFRGEGRLSGIDSGHPPGWTTE